MKKNIILVTLLFIGCLILKAQSKEEHKLSKKEKAEVSYNKTKKLIESGEFKFDAQYAFPISSNVIGISSTLLNTGSSSVFQGNRINLAITGVDYSVKIRQKEADIYLAYFGQSRRTLTVNDFNNDDIPIRFLGDLEDYDVSFDDEKREIHIKFSGTRAQEKYKFHLTINSNKSVILNVNSNGRQSIRYQGSLKPFEAEDKIGSVAYGN